MPTATQPAGRRLALFDLDGTLTRRDTFFPFVLGLLWRHPARWPRVALLLFPAIGYLLRRVDRGGLKGAIQHCLFAGMSRAVISERSRRYASAVVPARLHPAAFEAFQGHLAAGDHVVVLSASTSLFVPDIGRALGANEVICTEVRWNGDQLDGRLAGPNRRDHEKSRVLAQLRARLPGLPVIAYGNSGADLIHMFECEQAVYVNPGVAQAGILTQRGVRVVRWQ